MTRRTTIPSLPRRGRPGAPFGFTFIELLVVMGMMAVILGLGIGFLSRIGTGARVYQSAAILTEAGFECQNRSAGGRTATLLITREKDADGNEQLVVTQSVQRPILTSHFEDAEWTSAAAGPMTPKTSGSVKLDDNGFSGRCAVLGANGLFDFGTQAIFAPTDGVEVDVAIKPAGGHGAMTLLRGEDAYEVLLTKDVLSSASQDVYKVQLKVRIVAADPNLRADAGGTWQSFETKGSPVLADKWSQLQLSYNGRDAELRVNGVDRLDRPAAAKRGTDAPPPGLFRMALPPSGAVHLTVSSERYSYYGAIDDLSVSGIFRSDEDRRVLRGDVDVTGIVEDPQSHRARSIKPPLRIVWWNGRLDPRSHSHDETLELTAETEASPWRITFGLYGVITPPKRVEGAAPPNTTRTVK